MVNKPPAAVSVMSLPRASYDIRIQSTKENMSLGIADTPADSQQLKDLVALDPSIISSKSKRKLHQLVKPPKTITSFTNAIAGQDLRTSPRPAIIDFEAISSTPIVDHAITVIVDCFPVNDVRTDALDFSIDTIDNSGGIVTATGEYRSTGITIKGGSHQKLAILFRLPFNTDKIILESLHWNVRR